MSPLERFVLSHVSDASDLSRLGGLTGLPSDRLEEILDRLVQLGALRAQAVDPPQSQPVARAPLPERAPSVEAHEMHEAYEAMDALESEAEGPALAPSDPASPALYQQLLRGLPLDERVQRARVAQDAELNAWCHDPSPKVIAAVLENPRTGLTQARLVARHHRDARGLANLAGRAAFAADDVVRRELLRNPQLQPGLIRKLWGQRRLLDQWKWSASRETTEQARRTLRETLRGRFAAAGVAEERVEMIIKTEGRCLGALSGIPVDSKTTALLCGRPYASTMLIQNLGRWSAAAPVLIAHLLRQPLVRRVPSLKAILTAHPNAPKELH